MLSKDALREELANVGKRKPKRVKVAPAELSFEEKLSR